MSLRKLCCFTALAAIVIFVIFLATKALQVQRLNFDVATANLQRHSPGLQESVPYMAPPANQLVRSRFVCGTESECSQPVFLPVQFKNPEDLGLGKLLVASRRLGDPIFAKTVVLLVHYDADSVVGLMLNRRTGVPLSRVFEKLKAAKNRSDPVYLGGPVETPAVFALLRSKAKREPAERILEEVYLISTKSLLEKTLSARPGPEVFPST
jgi:hypothetical protein